jgi:hypothetical protein
MSADRPDDKSFTAKRIFLSYGHDEHAPIARRLRDDLMTRGHQVWFDENELKAGDDWERHIEEGIEWLAADSERNRSCGESRSFNHSAHGCQ